MKTWSPAVACSKREELLLKACKKRRLFVFLRLRRHEIFNKPLQEQLGRMYRDTGAGEEPQPPAMMCMALLLQCCCGVSDSEAVRMATTDMVWQMLLGCLGQEEPAFSQGGLQQFRERLIKHDMDRVLLERTIELARETTEFDWRKLPKDLRLAVDSSPFEGAGRVEDTFNLLGHAARRVIEIAARVLKRDVSELANDAGIPIVLASSVKAGLDVDWTHPEARTRALNVLDEQVRHLRAWLEKADLEATKPLAKYIEVLKTVQHQNIETLPTGLVAMIEGVAPDRTISVEDTEMRHGRKTKSKLFNGYKRHIGVDLDSRLILACSLTPANQPEALGAEPIKRDIARQGFDIAEFHSDLAYVHSSVATEVLAAGGQVVSKPWPTGGREGRLGKGDFSFNMRDRTVTCPAGQTEHFKLGQVVTFDAAGCDPCAFREQCTTAPLGRGRTISIAEDELLQQRARKVLRTSAGREKRRERVAVEHRLAHVAQRQGRRARYRGTRRNLYDLRRTSAVLNLQQIQLVANQ